MTEKQEQAVRKLEAELRSGTFSRSAEIMKNDVCSAMQEFSRQSEEFARAVVDRNFADCMREVERGISHGGISDLEAFRRAAGFYFPGAEISFRMEIRMSAYERDAAPKTEIIDLSDFL